MTFKIAYVEDREADWTKLHDAVHALNGVRAADFLELLCAPTPEALGDLLTSTRDVDLVLADVYFPNLRAGESAGESDRLSDIIAAVRNHERSDARPVPIIAYTGMGLSVLEACLARSPDLYDIWDKNTAKPDYVAWRLSRIAEEIQRAYPDSRMARLVSLMPSGASWHSHVVEMAQRYGAGDNETDQLARVAGMINAIAAACGATSEGERLWNAMMRWEPLSRASHGGIRGHARHVINVFWMGYYLIHHEALRSVLADAWRHGVEHAPHLAELRGMDATAALADAWFFAALFHDVAGCVEKAEAVAERVREVSSELLQIHGAPIEVKKGWASELLSYCEEIIKELPPSARAAIEPHMSEWTAGRTLDHGFAAGAVLRRDLGAGAKRPRAELRKRPGMSALAYAASRAMAIHNLFPTLSTGACEDITWQSDILTCLLLLCDQLQSWDRERQDQNFLSDWPDRAELRFLSVAENPGRKPKVDLGIDYILPPHTAKVLALRQRVQDKLQEVIEKRPRIALNRIGGEWPFVLRVECSLSGTRLPNTMHFE